MTESFVTRTENGDPVDAVMKFHLYTVADGGRPWSIPKTAEFFSCSLFDGEHYWDCRIWLNGSGIELGVEYERPIMFLSPQEASKTIRPGTTVPMREYGFVGQGEIVSLRPDLV